MAIPVLLVLVSAGHSKVASGGMASEGAAVSRTVIVWTRWTLLPQASVAVHRRAITFVPPQLLVVVSLKVITTEPQPSWAAAMPVLLVLVSAGQSKVRSGGGRMEGGVVWRTGMVWTGL